MLTNSRLRTWPALPEAEAEFARAYPEYAATRLLDELRATDYSRLDRTGQIYLDYTGGGLYAESQVRAHAELLLNNVYGNPHSTNPTSHAMTERVEATRAYVLRYFRASPEEYTVIFTQNASGALKLVGEAFPFAPGSQYLLTFDNHNSVNGIREFALAKGATVTYAPVRPPDLRLDDEKLAGYLEQLPAGQPGLFAYPAQSNFSGVQHSLEWIARAQALGWQVLLDAAAFTPSNRLDLSQYHPDFVAQSFYKIFGYPTGLGCLLARKAALATLHRPWYAGGTIAFASVQSLGHYLVPNETGFEDGTVNYLGIPAIEIGLKHIERIGIDTIHTRVMCLARWLLAELTALRHANGAPVVQIYGPVDARARGGSIALNFFDPHGQLINCHHSLQLAGQVHLSVRSGCHCNPGAHELSFGFNAEELAACFKDKNRMTLDEFRTVINGKTTGALRVSVGLVSTFADVYRFVEFARGFAAG